MVANTSPVDLVEAIFPIEGKSLPRDHAQALQRTLAAELPWLDSDVGAAILPLKLVLGSENPGLLSPRTRLILRAYPNRLDTLRALAGRSLEVAGHSLRLGAVHLRALQPHTTLYSYGVSSSSADEVEFMQQVERELDDLAVGGERVCGKRNRLCLAEEEITTFSLMLHGLVAQQSLRVQQMGLGPHRLLGCGIFVPHKSAAAVGS